MQIRPTFNRYILEGLRLNEFLNPTCLCDIEVARSRLLAVMVMFFVLFLILSVRLTDIMIFRSSEDVQATRDRLASAFQRSDIVDRNGELLATTLVTASVYANPKMVQDAAEAATKLAEIFPELGRERLLSLLSSGRGFVWLKRHISPKQQHDLNQQGIPGVFLLKDQRRIYPHGSLVSHVLGYSDIDNNGTSGIEKYFNERLRTKGDILKLSLDVRVQHILRDELEQGIKAHMAKGGNGMIVDFETGQILAMVSLPDYDPNKPNKNTPESTFNRNTLGIYEMGSTFKIINTAIALHTGKATLGSIYDASAPIKYGRFKITDFQGKNRPLDVREIFIYSSNIGSALMARDFGAENQQKYFRALHLLQKPTLELPEVGAPLTPKTWRDITLMTASYGYGISVSPLQIIAAIRAVLRGPFAGLTLLADKKPLDEGGDIFNEKTRRTVKDLLQAVILEGTAKKANVPGYQVIGKTGTAHKISGNGYANKAKITSFIGAFPKDNPKYMVMIGLDEPQPTKETFGFATGGWTAAPLGGRVIARIAPLLNLQPIEDITLSEELSGLIDIAAGQNDENEE